MKKVDIMFALLNGDNHVAGAGAKFTRADQFFAYHVCEDLHRRTRGGFKGFSMPLPENREVFSELVWSVRSRFGMRYMPLMMNGDITLDLGDTRNHQRFCDTFGPDLDYIMGDLNTLEGGGPLPRCWQGVNKNEDRQEPPTEDEREIIIQNVADGLVMWLKGRKGFEFAAEALCIRENWALTLAEHYLAVAKLANAKLGPEDGKVVVLPDTAHQLWSEHWQPGRYNKDIDAHAIDFDARMSGVVECIEAGLVSGMHFSYPDLRGAFKDLPRERDCERMLDGVVRRTGDDDLYVVIEIFLSSMEVIKKCLNSIKTFEERHFLKIHGDEYRRVRGIADSVIAGS